MRVAGLGVAIHSIRRTPPVVGSNTCQIWPGRPHDRALGLPQIDSNGLIDTNDLGNLRCRNNCPASQTEDP